MWPPSSGYPACASRPPAPRKCSAWRCIFDTHTHTHHRTRTTAHTQHYNHQFVTRETYSPIIARHPRHTTQINESKDRLEHILASLKDAFIALDSQQRYTYVNSNAAEMLGARKQRTY